MTQRVLGPEGSPRRRWTLLLTLAVVFAFGLIYIAGAGAVHNAGAFELDTPSANAEDGVGGGEADPDLTGDDWDNICADNPTTCTFKSGTTAGTSSASSSSHENDGSLNATIFSGGGSKDIYGIQSGAWAWKDGAGGLPDKDNLLHAYAAKYTVPTSDECVGAGGNTDGTQDCVLIYFGSDRFANDGDATQAFWFLQNQVTLGDHKVGGATGFDGEHRDGDILIISEFSNGGDKSTITVYKWVGDDATGHIEFLAGGDNKDCDIVPFNDPFCGVVNKNTEPTFSPWEFLDKAGTVNFRQGELFEAGINLSDPAINLAEECFSSFVAETRSSTSTSAQLKDFVLGQFEICAPDLTTQASTNGTVLPGTPVTDDATIEITGAANPDDATGSVTFYLCGPDTSATACSSSTGTTVSTNTLVDTSDPADANDGISGATSDQVNTSGDPLDPGFYCFAATADLTNYSDPTEFSNATTECFRVRDTTAIATTQSWLPQDSATITTGSGAEAPAGTVVFTLYDSNNCTGTVLGTFTDTTSPYSTNNQTSVSVSSTKSVSWSATFTPTDTNAFAGSTTTRCERSDLTINNSASDFPPSP